MKPGKRAGRANRAGRPATTRVYHDEVTDDFGNTQAKAARIDETYHYQHSRLWRLLSNLTFFGIVTPAVWLICKAVFHVRVKNKRALRSIKGGYFVYATHTQPFVDAVSPAFINFPTRVNVITGRQAVRGLVLGFLVPFFGGVPLNSSEQGKRQFRQHIAKLIAAGHAVSLMPEAHLWPYYNGIRHFSPYSFTYPEHLRVPVVGQVITFRQRKFLKNRPPYVTISLSEPIWPEEWADQADPKTYLRDRVYDWMCQVAEQEHSYGYINYVDDAEAGAGADTATDTDTAEGERGQV